jgi:lysophospholipase L1-like esterase
MKNAAGILITLVLLSGLTACQARSKLGVEIPVRIMAMGDSITEGACDTEQNCAITDSVMTPLPGNYTPACNWSLNATMQNLVGYRAFLREKLADSGVKAVNVGSVSVVEGLAHEGHSGWTTADIDFCVQNSDWMDNSKPDMILLHTGSNDILYSIPVDTAVENLSKLLEHIYAKLPKTTYVIVAQIIMVNSEYKGDAFSSLPTLANDLIAEYNTQIPVLVEQFRKQGKNVSYLDMSPVVQSNDDLFDDFHPIPATYQKMSELWYGKIVEVLNIGD